MRPEYTRDFSNFLDNINKTFKSEDSLYDLKTRKSTISYFSKQKSVCEDLELIEREAYEMLDHLSKSEDKYKPVFDSILDRISSLKHTNMPSADLFEDMFDVSRRFYTKFEALYQKQILLLNTKINKLEKQVEEERHLRETQNEANKDSSLQFDRLIRIDKAIKEFLSNQITVKSKDELQLDKFSGVDFDLNELYNFLICNSK